MKIQILRRLAALFGDVDLLLTLTMSMPIPTLARRMGE
jgi:hypothetical protein